jgi:enoyl-CoA hydratase/carnithine racemase
MSTDDSVRYDVTDDGIAIITLNRPDQLNAMSSSMGLSLMACLDRSDQDSDVRAVIFTGEGRAFCAGADLSEGSSIFTPTSDRGVDRDWGGVVILRIFESMKPTIAAINGAAVGLGATITLPCDIRLGATTSKFGFVFARRGIVVDGCASWFLPRVVGISLALKWCLSGDLITPEEALAAGLISSLHESSDVLPAALDMARSFVGETSPVAVALNRKLLWHGLTESHPIEAHRLESSLMGFMSAGPDAREGVESFLEKRTANFVSRVPQDLPATWPLWEEPEFS